jgi:hypothetical protein
MSRRPRGTGLRHVIFEIIRIVAVAVIEVLLEIGKARLKPLESSSLASERQSMPIAVSVGLPPDAEV